MIFTYETQGAITYLVCELEPAEQVDSLTLGMLTNNHIPGVAPVLYTEMNGQRFLKYNISAKITAEQFFSATMNKLRALIAFQNILSAVCSADEYMIDPNCFTVVPEHIYLNVSSCETAMVCIPVITDKDIHQEVAAFFKKILASTQFDSNEDMSYVTQLTTYVNSGADFSVYGLKDVVNNLLIGAPTGIPMPAAVQAPKQSVVPAAPAQQSVISAAPASSFDSTISIDDMPAMMAQKQAQKAPMQTVPMPPVVPVQPVTPVQPVAPVQPSVRPAQPAVPPQAISPVGRPINSGLPIQNNLPAQPVTKPAQPPVIPQAPAMPKAPVTPKPPVQIGPGFAIPGQPVGAAKPPMPMPPAQKQPKVENIGEKKMSFFGLLSHYNKENAELYKKQKEEAKAKKAALNIPAQPPVAPVHGKNGALPVSGQNQPAGIPVQPSFVPAQYGPPVQPVPVQNSFNETTVLSPSMLGGETTVLNVNPCQPDPCLTRVKTGERISINKPVFRIGKEKSYVDYFIADNTAISRSHANIHTENGEYFIEDTNSTNHTYINGSLIASNVKTKLTSGDKVKLANEDFTFTI